MTFAPAMDLRDAPANDGQAGLPHNIEAEQALLGILLFDNGAYERVGDQLRAEAMFEPFHQRLYARIEADIRKGHLAEPILLAKAFEGDEAFGDLGGLRYLADLVDRAPPSLNAVDYAASIMEQAAYREMMRVGAELMAAARRPGPIEAKLEEAERAIHRLAVTDSRAPAFTTAQDASQAVLDYLDNEEDVDGVNWGLEPLDRALGPMQAADLVVLGGRTSMGKSALASDLCLNVAMQGRGVIEINGEMTVQQMTRRHLTSLAFTKYGKAAPSYTAIRKRMVTREQRAMLVEAKAEFDRLPISLLQRPGLGFGALRSLVRKERAKMARDGVKLGLLIVDHAGLIKADGGGRSRYEDQTAVSNGMKELAHELGIPVMALAQLSRETEKRDNKRPSLSDLRDSGAWEQDADVVIGVYRDAYYAKREPEPKDDGVTGSPKSNAWAEWDRRCRSKTIEAIILKAREGDCTTVELWGDMATNAIRAREPGEPNSGDMF